MFSPIILICNLAMTDCGVMATPMFRTMDECVARTEIVISGLTLPAGLKMASWFCHDWGRPL
jgi:hypothetical protein